MRAQTFCEREHELRLYLDPCGTARYEEIPDRMKLKVVPAWHHEIQAIVPGSVRVGEPFDIGIRVVDQYGNPTPRYWGNVYLKLLGAQGSGIPECISFAGEHEGVIRISNVQIQEEGFWSLMIEDPEHGYKCYSNGSRATASDEDRLFWGDMHAQTKQTVGTGFLEDYFSFARDKGLVDFAGWQGNDFEISDETWADVRKNAKEFNEEGRFLTYLGYEWSGITPLGGDHNVHFLDDSEVFYPSSNWTETQVDSVNNASPITELQEKLKGRKDVMLIPHIGGRYANLDYYNPEFSSVIEIHSHHGTFEWFALEAMARRLKVGFIAQSDDHTCRVGLSYPLSGHGKSASGAFDVASGHAGVYAENLTKQSIWDAIKARHCYASTFDRVYLNTSVNGIRMGDEGTLNEAPRMEVAVNGSYPIETIEIYDWDQKIVIKELLKRDAKRIRIRWSGVVYRGRGKSAKWDGYVYVAGGKIYCAETYAFDRLDQGIVTQNDQYVRFTSSTSGDYDGLILTLDASEDTVVRFSTKQGTVEATYQEIMERGVRKNMGGLNLAVEIAPAYEEIALEAYPQYLSHKEVFELEKVPGEHAYWTKILQTNGNACWSSPVFVTVEE